MPHWLSPWDWTSHTYFMLILLEMIFRLKVGFKVHHAQ